MDRVFVAARYWGNETQVLDWVLDNFENDKTKIILTFINDTTMFNNTESNKSVFNNKAQNNYLPKCSAKKFQAEVLIPQEQYYYLRVAVVELITKYGMEKLVFDTHWKSEVLRVFDQNPFFWCKIWFVQSNGELDSIREFVPLALQKAQMEVEKLKKIAVEETNKRQKAENEVEKLKRVIDEEMIKPHKIQLEVEMLKKIVDEAMIKQQKAQSEVKKWKKIADDETMKREIMEEKLQLMSEQTKINEQGLALSTNFTFQELEEATQNFSDSLKIGGGGLGSVYKGTFRGTTVAIKKFESQSKQDLPMFQQEVIILSTIRHPNLVTLIGGCAEPPTLVYEFLSRGSLRNYLNQPSNTTPLPWQIRTRIIGDICLALIFLHSNKPNIIVHGDLRPDNIFLDANFTSKIGDFGLIKLADTDISTLYRTTDPGRTFAYIDPEFLTTGEVTSESDVYSFGVIVLHLLTGKSTLNIRKTIEESMGTDKFRTMIDGSAGKWPFQHAEDMAKIGIRCADVSRSKRPNLINEVWPTVESLMKFPDEIK